MNPPLHARAALAVVLFALASPAAAAPRVAPSASVDATAPAGTQVFDVARHFDANDLDFWTANDGSLAYDRVFGGPGLEFPRGTGQQAIFAAGLWVGAQVAGQKRVTAAEYSVEWAPGRILGGAPENPGAPALRTYKVVPIYKFVQGYAAPADSGWLGAASGDPLAHEGWGTYVAGAGPLGAPYATLPLPNPNPPPATVDVTGPILPGHLALWSVFNDADPQFHTATPGSSPPLGLTVQQTVFGYGAPLPGVAFVWWNLSYNGATPLDSVYVGFWCDPDLGGASDDLVGWDPAVHMGYAYNGQPTDVVYGAAPPAVGIVPIGNFAPLSDVALAGFAPSINGGDPVGALQSYAMLQGLTRQGNELVDPTSGLPTRFAYPGDPIAGAGWLDATPTDKRFLVSIGPVRFVRGESRTFTFAIVAAQGRDRLDSIARLRCRAIAAQQAPDNGYLLPFPAPGPACDFPVPVALTLEESGFADGAVRLAWYVGDPAAGPFDLARRRDAGEAWDVRARLSVDGARRVTYVDRDVSAGERWEYGLFDPRSPGRPLDVAAVTVPGTPAFALRVLPAAAGGAPGLLLSLPGRGEARLEVFDAAGRREAAVSLGVLDAGAHPAPLPAGATGPGLRFVRLTFAGRSTVARAVLLR